MTQYRMMGLDVGDARIGIALSDPTRLLAFPLLIISRNDGRPAERIAELVAEKQVTGVVIGLPKNMDGTEGPQARKVVKLGVTLQRLLPAVPIVYWDERRSTMEARALRIQAGAGKSKRASHIDANAAAVILQNYLDFIRNRPE